ncbi:hypothetical protein [Tetragenococcus halophilus]|uniref:hypothetical protein n=1 Tax=Tetragenococcus halophilus TaxID=51669 RepID=UPI002A9F27A0|nr:hypothetical protein TEHSL10_11630 [Tetragenococcus halophilus]
MLFEMAIKFTITSGFAKPLKEQLEKVKDKIQDSYEIETSFLQVDGLSLVDDTIQLPWGEEFCIYILSNSDRIINEFLNKIPQDIGIIIYQNY